MRDGDVLSRLARAAAGVSDPARCGHRRIPGGGERPRRDVRAHADLEFGAQGVVARLSDGAEHAAGPGQRRACRSLIRAIAGRCRAGGCARSAAAAAIPNSRVRRELAGERSGHAGAASASANYLRAEALAAAGRVDAAEGHSRAAARARAHRRMDRICAWRWRGAPSSDPWRFDARAKFRDVGFAPRGPRSGPSRAVSGSLAGNEAAGHVIIDTAVRRVQLARSVSAAHRAAAAQDHAVLEARRAGAAGGDFRSRAAHARWRRVHGKIAWRQPADGSSPVLTLASYHRQRQRGRCAAAIFPHELLPPGALQWLDRAFVAGHVSHGDAVFEGPVRRLPVSRRRRDCS